MIGLYSRAWSAVCVEERGGAGRNSADNPAGVTSTINQTKCVKISGGQYYNEAIYGTLGGANQSLNSNYAGDATDAGGAAGIAGGGIYNSGIIENIIIPMGINGNYVLNQRGGDVYGGGIYNKDTGLIKIIDLGSPIMHNYVSSDTGTAYGGAIYNAGTIGKINLGAYSSFTENRAVSAGGSAFGGAIYTTKNMKFHVGGGTDLSFSGNYVQGARELAISAGTKIYNAIFAANTLDLNFEIVSSSKITFDDQIEGGGLGYNIYITGDGTGAMQFNNSIINAKRVEVADSELILGSISQANAGVTDTGGYNHGLFVPSYDTPYGPGAPLYDSPTSLVLDHSKLTLKYNDSYGGGPEDLRLAGLVMRNESQADIGMHSIYVNEYMFYGKNTMNITGTAFFRGMDGTTASTLGFYLPADATNNYVALTLNGAGDITDTEVKIGINGGDLMLDFGDKIILIDATSLAGLPVNSVVQGVQGSSLIYDFTLDNINNQLIATVTGGGRLNPQSKAFSEGNMAGLLFVSQATDMISNIGIANAVQSARNSIGTVGMFTGGYIGKSRYETGSHVNIGGISLMAGLAMMLDDDLTVGGFAEYGAGTYNSYNEFPVLKTVEGDGRTNYAGVGLIGNYAFQNGLYIQGSLRGGAVENHYESDDILTAIPGQVSSFDSSSAYYGGHFGLGYIKKLTNGSEVDASVKYMAMLLEGHNAKISTGDSIKFDNVLSNRIRAGARLTLGKTSLRPYAGAFFDYEIGSEAKATIKGFNVGAPTLSGGTLVGQAGVALERHSWSFSVGGEGYAGVRQGLGLMLAFKYRFGVTRQPRKAQNQEQTAEFMRTRELSQIGADNQSAAMYGADGAGVRSAEGQAASVMSAPAARSVEKSADGVTAESGPYMVQVGAYYTEEYARKIMAKIQYISNAAIEEERDMYKVRVKGLSATDAKNLIQRLRSEENMRPGLIKNGRWIRSNSI